MCEAIQATHADGRLCQRAVWPSAFARDSRRAKLAALRSQPFREKQDQWVLTLERESNLTGLPADAIRIDKPRRNHF